MSLEEPLLDKDKKSGSFGVSRNELMELFVKENRSNYKGGVPES